MFPFLEFLAYAPADGSVSPEAATDAGQAAASAGGGGITGIIIWLVIMVALFYFMIIMPQRKRDKNFKNMMSKLKEGDKVVTAGGILGKVTMIKGDSVRIRTGSGSDLDITRKSISAILSKGDSQDVEPEVDKKASKELPKDNSKDTGAKK